MARVVHICDFQKSLATNRSSYTPRSEAAAAAAYYQFLARQGKDRLLVPVPPERCATGQIIVFWQSFYNYSSHGPPPFLNQTISMHSTGQARVHSPQPVQVSALTSSG
jgi:hypothetical protein